MDRPTRGPRPRGRGFGELPHPAPHPERRRGHEGRARGDAAAAQGAEALHEASRRIPRRRRSGESLEVDEALFKLRALRKGMATERGVPPYILFNDRSLAHGGAPARHGRGVPADQGRRGKEGQGPRRGPCPSSAITSRATEPEPQSRPDAGRRPSTPLQRTPLRSSSSAVTPRPSTRTPSTCVASQPQEGERSLRKARWIPRARHSSSAPSAPARNAPVTSPPSIETTRPAPSSTSAARAVRFAAGLGVGRPLSSGRRPVGPSRCSCAERPVAIVSPRRCRRGPGDRHSRAPARRPRARRPKKARTVPCRRT